jgi:hypothetical protein
VPRYPARLLNRRISSRQGRVLRDDKLRERFSADATVLCNRKGSLVPITPLLGSNFAAL